MEVAIQRDCKSIIERFVSNNNPSFESFVQQWKSSSFQRIYTAQSSLTQVIQSTNICFHYAKRVLSQNSTLSKLGALYLLYAIYFKQPTEQYQKIDIDLGTWTKLKEFLTGLDESCANEARCIFWKLMKDNAFRFVASDTYHGLENFLDLDKVGNSVLNSSKAIHLFGAEVNELNSRQGLLAGLLKLDEGYNEMKDLMNLSSAGEQSAALLPVSNNFEELQTAMDSLQAFMRNNTMQNAKKEKKVIQEKEGVKKRAICKGNFRTGGRVVLKECAI